MLTIDHVLPCKVFPATINQQNSRRQQIRCSDHRLRDIVSYVLPPRRRAIQTGISFTFFLTFLILFLLKKEKLSSPRAESAMAVTGRRCPHSGRGEDFLSRQPDFFLDTAVTPERKVEKSFPRWEINRHAEG